MRKPRKIQTTIDKQEWRAANMKVKASIDHLLLCQRGKRCSADSSQVYIVKKRFLDHYIFCAVIGVYYLVLAIFMRIYIHRGAPRARVLLCFFFSFVFDSSLFWCMGAAGAWTCYTSMLCLSYDGNKELKYSRHKNAKARTVAARGEMGRLCDPGSEFTCVASPTKQNKNLIFSPKYYRNRGLP